MKKIKWFVIISIILCFVITAIGLLSCWREQYRRILSQTTTVKNSSKTNLDKLIIDLRPQRIEQNRVQEVEQHKKILQQKKQEEYRRQFFKEDCPLNENLQEYIYSESQKQGIQYLLILALIKTESNFRPEAVSANRNGSYDIGLFQINSVHYNDFLSQGYDLYNTKDNIKIGVEFIAGLVNKFGVQGGLMAYNMGVGGYYNAVNNGIYSTDYSRKVIENQYCFE